MATTLVPILKSIKGHFEADGFSVLNVVGDDGIVDETPTKCKLKLHYGKFEMAGTLAKIKEKYVFKVQAAEEAAAFLPSVKLFEDLDRIKCLNLAYNLKYICFNHDDIVVYEGRKSSYFYIIIKGHANVHREISAVPVEVSKLYMTDLVGATDKF